MSYDMFMKRNLAAAALLVMAATATRATVYSLPEQAPPVFGVIERIHAVFADTLPDLARHFSLGYEEIVRANPGVDPWLPGAGVEVTIPGRRILPPGPREGIVINLPEHRLYYFPKRKKNEPALVVTFPVSIGKMDWHTPLGETRIIGKQKLPSWRPPESVRKEHAERGEPLPLVVPAGPDNPLGEYAMRLDVKPGSYLIHGTNNPVAVGMAVTHGCIRMYPEDIRALYSQVPVGTKVWLINEPVKVAYVDGQLLLEVHPPVDAQGQTMEPNLELLAQHLDQALGATTAAIHWDYAIETLQAARGIPTIVALEADLNPATQADPATVESKPATVESAPATVNPARERGPVNPTS
jgi:L,D-transpeptidase ErfK/SrfK